MITRTGRGFIDAGVVQDTRGGSATVRQSSAAVCDGDAVQSGYVWLSVRDVVHHGVPVEASLHLSHEQALELADRLTALVKACEEAK